MSWATTAATLCAIGLNHACWSVRHDYAGQSVIPLLQGAYDRVMADPAVSRSSKRLIELACFMGCLPAE